jgi:hypothetical protein
VAVSGVPIREERLRVMVLWVDETEWRVWGRFSKNMQRTYDEAAALEAREDVADVRIDRTTTVTDQLSVAEFHAQLVATPVNRLPRSSCSPSAALNPQEQP